MFNRCVLEFLLCTRYCCGILDIRRIDNIKFLVMTSKTTSEVINDHRNAVEDPIEPTNHSLDRD